MVTLLSRYVNNLRKDRRAERSAARQTLRPPQRALAAIPKRSLVICTPPDARGSILRDCNHLWRVGHAWLWLASSVPSLARPSHIHLSSLALISAPDSRPAENPRPSPCAPSRGPRGLERFSQRCDSYESHILPPGPPGLFDLPRTLSKRSSQNSPSRL